MKNPVVRWKGFGNIDTASSRLRVFRPISILKSRGWDVDLYRENDFTFNIIVFQKAYTETDIRLAEHCKALGKKVIFDLCDNYFYNPQANSSLMERAGRLNRLIALSDTITVSSEELKKYINHSKVSKIDDATEEPRISKLKKVYFKLTASMVTKGKASLVWFGNSGSDSPRFGMIDLVGIVSVLNELNEELPIRLNVISDSYDAFNRNLEGSTFEAHFVKWERRSFPYIFAQHQLCLLPISRNPFTDCKTGNRIILSLQLGVPIITDLIPSYEEFADFILFSNWKQNILSAIRDPSTGDKIQRAKKYIEEKYNDNTLYQQWSNVLSA